MIGALVARPSSSCSEEPQLYVPGVRGNVNVSVRSRQRRPGGVRVPFRYCSSQVGRRRGAHRKQPDPIPAMPGPFAIVAVTVPPGATVVALGVTVVAPQS